MAWKSEEYGDGSCCTEAMERKDEGGWDRRIGIEGEEGRGEEGEGEEERGRVG